MKSHPKFRGINPQITFKRARATTRCYANFYRKIVKSIVAIQSLEWPCWEKLNQLKKITDNFKRKELHMPFLRNFYFQHLQGMLRTKTIFMCQGIISIHVINSRLKSHCVINFIFRCIKYPVYLFSWLTSSV